MKNIVLVDFTLDGHHLSFLRDFIVALRQLDFNVIALVPEAKKLKEYIRQTETALTHFTAIEFIEYKTSKTKNKLQNTINHIKKWHSEAKQIKALEKALDLKVDLVFYAWLDNQFARFIHPSLLDKIFPFKWAGLFFHPYHLRLEPGNLAKKASWRDVDSILLAKNCIGITIHDQSIIESLSTRIGKPVIHFPETADDTPPDLSNSIYLAIKEKARNRIVVGMIGCEGFKGTLTMMRLAEQAGREKFFFAFLGNLPRNTYTVEDWETFNNYVNTNPENAFFYFERINEGADYNAVFSSFDIPFLVYDNFISSSNRLTKAAIFKKLVLASDNFCVGDDVRRYNLGKATPPKQVHTALQNLNALAEQIHQSQFPIKEWEAYVELNSKQMLTRRFSELLKLMK